MWMSLEKLLCLPHSLQQHLPIPPVFPALSYVNCELPVAQRCCPNTVLNQLNYLTKLQCGFYLHRTVSLKMLSLCSRKCKATKLTSLFYFLGFPGDSEGKESSCNAGELGSIPGLGRFPWRREQLSTPVCWPEEFHGKRNLAGYSPWSCKESDMTE